MPFTNKPILVFWETTRACALSCIHCRASAITQSLPGELTVEQGRGLIDQVAAFGQRFPTLIFTGGDPLMRRNDLSALVRYARDSSVGCAVSPAVTDSLTKEAMSEMKELGVSSISVSLDGASSNSHDFIRGTPGTFEKTLEVLRNASRIGLPVQVNTAIMKRNYLELPQIFHLLRTFGVKVWELFFLVKVGRGNIVEDLTAEENESVSNFIYDASFYDMLIRCVEGPFIRRVAKQRNEMNDYWSSNKEYEIMRKELLMLEGDPQLGSKSSLGTTGTLDGDGIIFVSYDGTICPGGLIPITLGNITTGNLVETYRDNQLLRDIRGRKFKGKCGSCEFREICGGSRARAFAYYADPLESDPACAYAVSSH